MLKISKRDGRPREKSASKHNINCIIFENRKASFTDQQ
jgi:hypothetical protein